jgi:hypothetical protein
MKFLLLTHLNSSKSGLVPELSRVTLSCIVARKAKKSPIVKVAPVEVPALVTAINSSNTFNKG